MSSTLTLTFQGLCMFVNRGTYYDVVLPTVDGHSASLVVRTAFVDTDAKKTTWKGMIRTVQFVDANGNLVTEQIQTWDLPESMSLSFPGATPGTLEPPTEVIDFYTLHLGSKPLAPPPPTVLKPVVLRLDEGKGTGDRLHDFTLFTDVTEKAPYAYAQQVKWAGLSLVLSNGTEQITFKADNTVEPVAAISNLSTDPTTLEHRHFAIYYGLVQLDAHDSKFKLKSASHGGGHADPFRSAETYDCVPPVHSS